MFTKLTLECKKNTDGKKSGLGMTRGWYLGPVQIKKKEPWAGNKKHNPKVMQF